MAWPWVLGHVTIPWDAKAQFQPQIQFLAQALARGESPFWNPYAFSGHPQIADPQSMIFSPPYLLLALVNGNPSAWAIDMTTLLAALVGAMALAVWMRDQGWHFAGAVIGGLVFCFGASMSWRMQHTGQVLSLAYWPMAMLAIDRAFDRCSYVCAVVAGVVGAVILIGRDQVALLVLYLLTAYVVCRWLHLTARVASLTETLRFALVGGGVAIVLAAVPLILTAQLAGQSNRPVIDFIGAGRGSLHPALLITAILPQVFGAAGRMEDYWGPPSFAWHDTGLFIAQNMGQIYIGALPVILILVALWRDWLWQREVRFFSVAFIVALLYALGWYTPIFRGLYTVLPGVDLYRRPADATFLMGGLGAILVGYAVHRMFVAPWEKFGEHATMFTVAIVGLAFACALGLALRIDRVGLLPWPLIAAVTAFLVSAMVLTFARSRIALEPWMATAILAAVTAVDLGFNNGPTTSSAMPTTMYDVLEPKSRNATIGFLKSHAVTNETRRDRVELLGLGFHWPNASLPHRLENTLGYNPVRLGAYSQATGAEDTIGLAEQRKLAPLMPSYRSMLVDMLGLRYVAAGQPLEKVDPKLKAGDWTLVAKTDEAWIYENPHALPRVLFVQHALGADFIGLLKTGTWPDGFDPKATVLLEMPMVPVRSGTSTGTGQARIVRYRNTDVSVEVESTGGGYVVLNDLWHPSWFAEIDGQRTELLKANVLFRAVQVPAGKHVVRFKFQPLRGALQALGSRGAL
ncbi:MAG: hypothetical protein ABL898_03190 [Hyphomicrobiaceae bacterium]|nr:hypothetical protein [Hyphomicrobiaceae bacterium]